MKIVPFYYLSLIDQVAQLFYDRDFVNKLITRSTAQKDVIGSTQQHGQQVVHQVHGVVEGIPGTVSK